MGQKTHPIGFRIGTQYRWRSNWFAHKNYADLLHEDLEIRKYIKKALKRAGLEKIEIERSAKKLKVSIFVSRPGMVIGRSGSGIENLRKGLEKISKAKVQVSVSEVKNPDLSAALIAQNIVNQIEKRVPAKRAMVFSLDKVISAGAKGVRIAVKGRIGGLEMARTLQMAKGSVPLHTLDSEIDYAQKMALTKYGTMGVKVWINLGRKSVRKKSSRKSLKPVKEKLNVDTQKN